MISALLCLVLPAINAICAQRIVKQCPLEKSGYFVIMSRLSYDQAALECVQQGAVLAPLVDGLHGLIETCAEWELDTVEPWIARRFGDTDCPYVGRHEHGSVALDSCTPGNRRQAVCWRYPVAMVTLTETKRATSTLTDYAASIVGTSFVIPSGAAVPVTTLTWTETVTETMTKQKRVPKWLPEYSSGASNVTLTFTVNVPVTVVKQVPTETVTEEALVLAVDYATVWQTDFTATSTAMVSVNCH